MSPTSRELAASARSPRNSPAPRISRSCVASTKPAPRSSSDSIASSRLAASPLSARARGHDQVGVGAVVRAADAAAQLVQLRQPEAVGAIDQNGVGARHVDAALDDGRAHQHVEASMIEIDHQLLELALAHLAVPDAHLRLGHQRGELGGDLLDASAPRCARSRPGRRAAARAGPHRAASGRATRITKVLIASRAGRRRA